MKTVCSLNQCAGCMACIDICPKKAITIKDTIDAYNAVINENLCINCNACHSICQSNNPAGFREPLQWKQGWSENTEIRSSSSSGGLAAALEYAFIKNGGSVCSCIFCDGRFIFSFADSCEDIILFAGSRYVKSNPEGAYKETKRRLQNGQKVLFVGLPCQVSAVRNYVGEKNAERLLTVDLICHGTPSPKILDTYLKECGFDCSNKKNVLFRNNNKFQLRIEDTYVGIRGKCDKYSIAFLNGISYTENCYSCQYAKKTRVSDITLGDSWGSTLPKEMQRDGVSLILCQTQKGIDLLQRAEVHLEEVDIKNAIAHNHQLEFPTEMPENRNIFFNLLNKGKKFSTAVWKCYPKNCIRQVIKSVLIKMHIKN